MNDSPNASGLNKLQVLANYRNENFPIDQELAKAQINNQASLSDYDRRSPTPDQHRKMTNSNTQAVPLRMNEQKNVRINDLLAQSNK
jgi:hypothetical protein